MKERPILFSSPMVRAILEGRKTQTRRVVGVPQPMSGDGFRIHHAGDGEWFYQRGEMQWALFKCPYGQPGSKLWVRETFTMASGNGIYPVYRADAVEDDSGEREGFWIADNFYSYEGSNRWMPSIHMPRKYSRITLEVTGVRVERLQEISEEDAKAEGVDASGIEISPKTHTNLFANLWDSINEERAPWSSNPWVWVVEFKRVSA